MLNLKKKNLKGNSEVDSYHLEKYKEPHKKRKMIYFLSALMILSLGIFIFYKSFAFYEEKKDFNVINGVVEDPGDLYFAYYVDGNSASGKVLEKVGMKYEGILRKRVYDKVTKNQVDLISYSITRDDYFK